MNEPGERAEVAKRPRCVCAGCVVSFIMEIWTGGTCEVDSMGALGFGGAWRRRCWVGVRWEDRKGAVR